MTKPTPERNESSKIRFSNNSSERSREREDMNNHLPCNKFKTKFNTKFNTFLEIRQRLRKPPDSVVF